MNFPEIMIILVVIMLIAAFVHMLGMLTDCFKHKGRFIWYIIILMFPVGSIIYHFKVKKVREVA